MVISLLGMLVFSNDQVGTSDVAKEMAQNAYDDYQKSRTCIMAGLCYEFCLSDE